jgi:hypothetical protein
MMAGAGRELAIAERAQDPAHRRLAHRDPELLPDPHRQVFQSPAYDPMDRRDRTALDHRRQSLALSGVQLAGMARRLAVCEPLAAIRVEPQHPVSDGLQADPADAGRLRARAAVIDLRQCQKAAPLGSALRRPRQPAQPSGIIVAAKCNPRSHGESPLRHHRF